jgi:hypothetical protein
MMEYRALGTVTTLASATNVGLEVSLADGLGNTVTLNSGITPYLTLSGSSRYPSLLTSLALLAKTWLNAAAVASGVLTATTGFDTDVDITPAVTANGCLCTLEITQVGYTFTASGAPALITAASLVQLASGIWTSAGLMAGPSLTRSATSTTASTATWAGLFQGRSVYCFERGEDDGGDTESGSYISHHMASGFVRSYDLVPHRTTRALRLLDQDIDMAGPPLHLGLLAAVSPVNGDRDTLTMANPSQVFSVGNPSYNQGLAEVGRYVSIAGRWVSRIRAVTSSTVQLWDAVPSTVTVPALGELVMISEAHALWYESLRLGAFVVYGLDEQTGLPLWNGESYAMQGGDVTYFAERRDIGNPLYSYTFNLLRKDVIG